MLERSQGKLRSLRPRSSDLAVPQPAPERSQGRDERGRFAPGHKSARGKGWKRAIRSLAGPGISDPELHALAGDAGSLYRARLGELPHQGATVSAIVAEGARSSVLSARFAAKALELGLDTDAGMKALELSMRLGQRAERTSITALDVATKLAEAERRKPQPWPWLVADEAASTSTSTTTDESDGSDGSDAAASQPGGTEEERGDG